jgi:pimeloyl-ACP methyl ester carboxylesterase
MADSSLIADLERETPPGDEFYTQPRPIRGHAYGDPIYVRPLNNATAALEGGENWLVLYRSEDAHGDPVATSGIIALPDRARQPMPEGGYPLVSWAHGTVGVANVCAPSRDWGETGASPMNAYPHELLNHFLSQGWAVAMTDYEALGAGTHDHLHPYLLGRSEAHGVLDIVLAARLLFGRRIADRFAIVGHSQGGQAALFAAHHAAGRADGLAGVAAIAPANHPLGGDAQIDSEQILSPAVYRDHWLQAWHRSRAGLSKADSWGGVKGNEQFRPGYAVQPDDDQCRFDRRLPAMNPEVRLTVPVRITQAADDDRAKAAPPLPLLGTDALVRELDAANRANGNTVVYQRYDEGVVTPDDLLGVHFATINHDIPALTDWLKPLLGGL